MKIQVFLGFPVDLCRMSFNRAFERALCGGLYGANSCILRPSEAMGADRSRSVACGRTDDHVRPWGCSPTSHHRGRTCEKETSPRSV